MKGGAGQKRFRKEVLTNIKRRGKRDEKEYVRQ
jgi:hypothetical protein